MLELQAIFLTLAFLWVIVYGVFVLGICFMSKSLVKQISDRIFEVDPNRCSLRLAMVINAFVLFILLLSV